MKLGEWVDFVSDWPLALVGLIQFVAVSFGMLVGPIVVLGWIGEKLSFVMGEGLRMCVLGLVLIAECWAADWLARRFRWGRLWRVYSGFFAGALVLGWVY